MYKLRETLQHEPRMLQCAALIAMFLSLSIIAVAD